MSGLLTDPRIGREFQTADEVESLPVGAVVIDSDGDAWQRDAVWTWVQAVRGTGSLNSRSLAEDFGSLLLVWLPPEAVSAR